MQNVDCTWSFLIFLAQFKNVELSNVRVARGAVAFSCHSANELCYFEVIICLQRSAVVSNVVLYGIKLSGIGLHCSRSW